MPKIAGVVCGLALISYCSSQMFTRFAKYAGKRIDHRVASYDSIPANLCWAICTVHQTCVTVNHDNVNHVCELNRDATVECPLSGTVHPNWDVYLAGRKCQAGWAQFCTSCYKIVTTLTSTWEEAEANCVSEGGHLVEITSGDENQFVLDQIAPHTGIAWLWIGGLRNPVDTGFTWRSGAPLSYTGWRSGEPDNWGDTDVCMAIMRVLGWIDVLCSTSTYSICETSLY